MRGTKQPKQDTLSVDAAREIIARGVANIFATANLISLPSASIKAWCERGVEAKAIEAEETTHARLSRSVKTEIRSIRRFGWSLPPSNPKRQRPPEGS
jgi:hypothetical protein